MEVDSESDSRVSEREREARAFHNFRRSGGGAPTTLLGKKME